MQRTLGYGVPQDFADLSQVLGRALASVKTLRDPERGRALLDAYLAAAGMSQVLEDFAAGRANASLGDLVQRLAPLTMGHGRDVQRLAASWQDSPGTNSVVSVSVASAARRTIANLPAAFVTFNQRPEDCVTLARLVAERWSDRKAPLAVVGIRTSGSYLAPLCAAALRSLGYESIDVLTWRAGQRWLPDERRRLQEVSQHGGLALIVDDPPTSGGNLAGAAEALQHLGFPRESVVLVFQAFESPERLPWPERLHIYKKVVLQWDQWAVQAKLAPEEVRATLQELLAGQTIRTSGGEPVLVAEVTGVERLAFEPPVNPRVRRSARGHVQARYRACLVESETGRQVEHHVYVKGVGLGYFGDQSAAVAERLEEFLPEVYGVRDGLLYREWLADDRRVTEQGHLDAASVARQVATYVAARQRRLPLPEDYSRRLRRREALWERAAHLLTQPFGRLAPVARLLLQDHFKELVLAAIPSLLDGSMTADQWFLGSDGALKKVDFDESVFWKVSPQCSDQVFDLAAAAVELPPALSASPRAFSDSLRETFTRLTGTPISRDRWALYQLLHLRKCQDRHRYDYRLAGSPRCHAGMAQALGPLERDLSRVLNGYLASLFLDSGRPPASGPLCAIDIDGVLETSWLGFPSMTPAGALALRTLKRHGFRVILATGRSLDEVRERCALYGLSGGVAEYGAAVYDHAAAHTHWVIDSASMRTLEAVRRALQAQDGVYLDSAFEYTVRAYCINQGAKSRLPDDVVRASLDASGFADQVRVIVGDRQTDFVPIEVDKATAVAALVQRLGRDVREHSGDRPLALAVGDSETDLGLFALAECALAPANADAAVRSAARGGAGQRPRVLRQKYQVGLLEAVCRMIGHRPGGSCPTCQPPVLSPAAKFLTGLLGGQDVGRPAKLIRALQLRRVTISPTDRPTPTPSPTDSPTRTPSPS